MLLLAALSACAHAGGGAAGAERARLRSAAEYSRAHHGHAVLVVRGDSVLWEEYQNGWHRDLPHPLASGTKTFACALAAAAAGDGLLELDEPVARSVPELANHPLGSRATVRQLLQLTSGLRRDNVGAAGQPPYDQYRNAVRVGWEAPPGERWAYGEAAFDLFGEVVRRKLEPRGEDPLRYLERRVLEPIGVAGHTWSHDRAGNPLFGGGAAMTARDWARFGRLLRDGGRWEGRPVVREELLRECFRGSEARPGYGMATWLNERTPDGWTLYGGRTELPGMVAASGYGNQHLLVIPSHGLVVVRLGTPDRAWRLQEFLARLLGDPVPPPRGGGPE